MKILVLEDNPERIQFFSESFIEHELVIVNNSYFCMFLLNLVKFDHLFLDHDLGGNVFVDSDLENNGYQVCKRILDSKNQHTPITVHSWNEPAANRMINRLLGDGCFGGVKYYPFSTQEFYDVVKSIVDK